MMGIRCPSQSHAYRMYPKVDTLPFAFAVSCCRSTSPRLAHRRLANRDGVLRDQKRLGEGYCQRMSLCVCMVGCGVKVLIPTEPAAMQEACALQCGPVPSIGVPLLVPMVGDRPVLWECLIRQSVGDQVA